MSFFNHKSVGSTDSGLHIESVHEDAPEFKRVYTALVDSRASIKVEIKKFMGTLLKSGELTQPNGRWILFDPDAVADKIIDPILVPLVQNYCDEINELDRQFRASHPSEYIDEYGAKWVRQ